MKIPFEKIAHEPLDLALTQKDTWVAEIFGRLVGDNDSTPDISANLEVSATGRTVRVRGTGSARYTAACARCLEDVPTEVTSEFDIALLPASEQPDEDGEEVELTEEELDEYTYDGQEIDLGDLLNEQFMLAQPYRVLCRDDCAGLCPNCGADLNKSPCECKKASGHPAFAALADIEIDDN